MPTADWHFNHQAKEKKVASADAATTKPEERGSTNLTPRPLLVARVCSMQLSITRTTSGDLFVKSLYVIGWHWIWLVSGVS